MKKGLRVVLEQMAKEEEMWDPMMRMLE